MAKILFDSTYNKFVVAFGILSFLLFTFLGGTHFGMSTLPDGTMTNCPFMGHAAICTMSPFEHSAAWQKALTALPFKDNTFLLTLLVFSYLAAAIFGVFFKSFKKFQLFYFLRLRFQQNFPIPPTPLQESFSNGILHPKVF